MGTRISRWYAAAAACVMACALAVHALSSTSIAPRVTQGPLSPG